MSRLEGGGGRGGDGRGDMQSSVTCAIVEWESRGYTVVWVATCHGGGEGGEGGAAWRRRMVVGLRDELRPEAKGVVKELRRRGVWVGILSGDSQVFFFCRSAGSCVSWR
jgi:cation transport ATPase